MGSEKSGLQDKGLPGQANERPITAEERARAVVLRYRTADPDTRPSLTAMIAEAIREAEQARRPVHA